MHKTLPRCFAALMLLLFFAQAAFAQFQPGAPFKPQQPQAPDFTLKDLDGKTFRLSAVKGKPVLIFFGTTWCPGCRKEIPKCNRINEKYSSKGLEVVYINIMEPAEKVKRFARTNNIRFRVLLDESGHVGTLYNAVGVPMLVLLNKDGLVVKVAHSSSDIPLDEILGSGN